ncbi:protein FAM228A isoform X7 [Oncorhynchus keta]|uniref:protein FAM228A isoform X7 n=1 Tax=Oncorhynchus keta TaxID=8018 RepID=UPI00227C580D|nr:protein FAM228A isoform X7 [Oncorhynchus keta]
MFISFSSLYTFLSGKSMFMSFSSLYTFLSGKSMFMSFSSLYTFLSGKSMFISFSSLYTFLSGKSMFMSFSSLYTFLSGKSMFISFSSLYTFLSGKSMFISFSSLYTFLSGKSMFMSFSSLYTFLSGKSMFISFSSLYTFLSGKSMFMSFSSLYTFLSGKSMFISFSSLYTFLSDMSVKDSGAAGLIVFHTSAPRGLLTSTVPSGVWRSVRKTGRRGRGGEKRRSEVWLPGPPRGPWVDWLSHTSFRRLQVKLESENQEARAITQPLLDTENGFVKVTTILSENGFVKDLERYLCQQERAELRKRELLHKRWTERVWTPIQRSVENQVPHCCYDEAERIRSMFLNYIHYCNSKVATPASRDPLFLQSRDGTKEKRAVLRCQTGPPRL